LVRYFLAVAGAVHALAETEQDRVKAEILAQALDLR
jgi:hypothetical protein